MPSRPRSTASGLSSANTRYGRFRRPASDASLLSARPARMGRRPAATARSETSSPVYPVAPYIRMLSNAATRSNGNKCSRRLQPALFLSGAKFLVRGFFRLAVPFHDLTARKPHVIERNRELPDEIDGIVVCHHDLHPVAIRNESLGGMHLVRLIQSGDA